MASFFALQPLLAAHLVRHVTAAQEIYWPRNLKEVEDRAERDVALHVLYERFDLVNQADYGADVTVRQKWNFIVACRDDSQDDPGAALLLAANDAIDQLLKALLGWQPNLPGAWQACLAPSIGVGSKPSWAYFPFSFNFDLTFSSR